jgi:hypothetical protein
VLSKDAPVPYNRAMEATAATAATAEKVL